MIKLRIVNQTEEGRKFNGLEVYLNVLEKGGTLCSECGEEDSSILHRTFEAARIRRGAVNLRLDSGFVREVIRFIHSKMGNDRALCLDCFELMVDDNLGGFAPAD